MYEGLAEIIALAEPRMVSFFLVFVRVAAMVSVLPGFGEQSIPVRMRLAIAISFTILVWPLVPVPGGFRGMDIFEGAPLILSEAIVGLMLGLSIRLILMALQFAGAIASHAASLAQLMGAGATPDPLPAIGNILVMGGLVLAFALGLHVKAIGAIALSFDTVPLGALPGSADVGRWGTAKASQVAAIAFTLSAPFVLASLAYNLVLGFINRAMPQLMVAFIGAPAITAAGILILFLAAPAILTAWHRHLDAALAAPFALP